MTANRLIFQFINQVVKGPTFMEIIRKATQVLLGAALIYAGISHLTTSRLEFQAQVPSWVPLSADFVVLASGVVEILLGLSLASLKYRREVGIATALFFIAIFPGNISQFVNGIDAFGLDTDRARAIRLLFQPLLVIWALWSTGVWPRARKGNRRRG
jgi:uncharacterized membrane protein